MTELQRLAALESPKGIVDVVLDTDAYNEIDDQFALSYALRSPDKINLCAIYAAPFHNTRSSGPKEGMERSYEEILKLLTLAGREDMKKTTFRGSETWLTDEKTPVESAVRYESSSLSPTVKAMRVQRTLVCSSS